MAASPIFVSTPKLLRQRLAAANTARDGSGTINALLDSDNTTEFAAPSTGTRIDRITFTSAQATAAASSALVGRIFISDNTGANWRLFREVAIATQTASTTAIGAAASVTFQGGLNIPSGVKVGVTISVYAGVQDQFDVIAEVGNY